MDCDSEHIHISRVDQMEKYVWTQTWPSFPPDNTLSAPSTLLVHSSGQPHVWIQQVTVQIEKQQVGESWKCYSPRCTRRESRWNLRRIMKKDNFQRVQPYPMKYSVTVIFVNVTSLEIFSQPQTLISDIMLPREKNSWRQLPVWSNRNVTVS